MKNTRFYDQIQGQQNDFPSVKIKLIFNEMWKFEVDNKQKACVP